MKLATSLSHVTKPIPRVGRAHLCAARVPVSVGGGRARVLLLRLKLDTLDELAVSSSPPLLLSKQTPALSHEAETKDGPLANANANWAADRMEALLDDPVSADATSADGVPARVIRDNQLPGCRFHTVSLLPRLCPLATS